MQASSGDPEIDAAYSTDTSPPPAAASSGDPEIDAAYHGSGSYGMLPSGQRATGNPDIDNAIRNAYKPTNLDTSPVGRAIGKGVATAINLPDIAGQKLADAYLDPMTSRRVPNPSGSTPRYQVGPGMGGSSPLVATALRLLPHAASMFGGGAAAESEGLEDIPRRIEPTLDSETTAPLSPAQAAVNRTYAGQSMGAAGTAPDLSTSSSGFQQAVAVKAQKAGGMVNPTAYENQREADKFGIKLMEGEATRDPVQYSFEKNNVDDPRIAARINKTEGQLVDSLDDIRGDAAPAHVANSPRENGQIAVDELKSYDEPIKADIKSKFDAANAAAEGGQLQMDGSSFVQRANAALAPQGKYRFLPSQVRGIIDDVGSAGGKMSLDDFQGYSTQLAAEVRKAQRAGDGNAVAAISKVRDELENTPPAGDQSAAAKGLYDQARSAARNRFDAMRADPAYAAAVDEASGPGAIKKGQPSPLADTFLDDYALSRSAPKSQLDLMTSKLSDDGKAALAAHTLSTIRKSAVGATGRLNPAGFNTALAKYSDKMDSLIDPDTRENLESLARVAHNAKVAPPGDVVNYSKSGVIMNAAQKLGEGAINAKTFGMGVPLVKGMMRDRAIESALSPGAGLDKVSLSDYVQSSAGR